MATPNFADKTIWTGDNLDILRGMNSECVDLIYLDPPFNSNKIYEAPVGSKAAGAAFKDAWNLSDLDVAWMGLIADEKPEMAYLLDAASRTHGKGMQSYLTMMAVRLLEMRRVLKDTGSIYLHCDPTASHYLKMLMDAVFGQGNFRNEIVWHYGLGGFGATRYFPRKHDTLLYYSKSTEYIFRVQCGAATAAMIAKYSHKDEDGKQYMLSYGKRYYMKGGKPFDSVWDIPTLAPTDKGERTGYPTQKPLALLDRIVKASSNEGDVVLDPFCGWRYRLRSCRPAQPQVGRHRHIAKGCRASQHALAANDGQLVPRRICHGQNGHTEANGH